MMLKESVTESVGGGSSIAGMSVMGCVLAGDSRVFAANWRTDWLADEVFNAACPKVVQAVFNWGVSSSFARGLQSSMS